MPADLCKIIGKTWHDKKIKPREFKKGDLVLLYQSRMGPKKPNLTIAWAGPYQSTGFTLMGV